MTFVTCLRQIMSADISKKYYISAAPQCLIPDESIPLKAMQVMDFIFVQWYNNPICNVDTSAFLNSFKAWSAQLSEKGSGPKLYISLLGCKKCAGSGYLKISTLKSTLNVSEIRSCRGFGDSGGARGGV